MKEVTTSTMTYYQTNLSLSEKGGTEVHREPRIAEENHMAHYTSWLVNNIAFCYKRGEPLYSRDRYR